MDKRAGCITLVLFAAALCGCSDKENGAEKTIYMSVKKIEQHEKKFRKGPYQGKGWRDDWDAMARKTVYRQLIGKWGVMSIDYQTRDVAISLANQIKEEQEIENGDILRVDFSEVDSEAEDGQDGKKNKDDTIN